MTELLYDGLRWLMQCRDRLMDRAQYVYHSADLTIPHDTTLHRVYEGVSKIYVRVVKGARRQWSPLLREVDFMSMSR